MNKAVFPIAAIVPANILDPGLVHMGGFWGCEIVGKCTTEQATDVLSSLNIDAGPFTFEPATHALAHVPVLTQAVVQHLPAVADHTTVLASAMTHLFG